MPDLGAVPNPQTAYPRLLPLSEVLDEADTGPPTAAQASVDLEGRAAALRTRAVALRASALTEAERQRIRGTLARRSAGGT